MMGSWISSRRMCRFLLRWLSGFFLLVALDLMWFSVSLDRVYKPLYQKIQKKMTFRLWSGILVWMLLSLMIASQFEQGTHDAAYMGFMGIFHGFIIYGVYNLTNYSLLYQYSAQVVAIDTLWGSIAMGLTSYALAALRIF